MVVVLDDPSTWFGVLSEMALSVELDVLEIDSGSVVELVGAGDEVRWITAATEAGTLTGKGDECVCKCVVIVLLETYITYGMGCTETFLEHTI